jgi:hypothetical protein
MILGRSSQRSEPGHDHILLNDSVNKFVMVRTQEEQDSTTGYRIDFLVQDGSKRGCALEVDGVRTLCVDEFDFPLEPAVVLGGSLNLPRFRSSFLLYIRPNFRSIWFRLHASEGQERMHGLCSDSLAFARSQFISSGLAIHDARAGQRGSNGGS